MKYRHPTKRSFYFLYFDVLTSSTSTEALYYVNCTMNGTVAGTVTGAGNSTVTGAVLGTVL